MYKSLLCHDILEIIFAMTQFQKRSKLFPVLDLQEDNHIPYPRQDFFRVIDQEEKHSCILETFLLSSYKQLHVTSLFHFDIFVPITAEQTQKLKQHIPAETLTLKIQSGDSWVGFILLLNAVMLSIQQEASKVSSYINKWPGNGLLGLLETLKSFNYQICCGISMLGTLLYHGEVSDIYMQSVQILQLPQLNYILRAVSDNISQ